MAERDLCANCGHWREEHYGVTGEWQGQRIGCREYQGIEPDEDRRARKQKELVAARKAIAQKIEQDAKSFYSST